jgi:glycosyltransferase involved in cell wall biosynthesis
MLVGNKMRVLMATPCYYPVKGGTEIVVQNLSVKLNEMGVHTDVMAFNMNQKWNPKWRGKMEKVGEISVFKVPALNWLPIEHSPRTTLGINLVPGRFANILKKYDVLHFHEDLTFPLFSLFVKKPKILHLHGFNPDYCKRYHLNRMILKHVADLYIAVSRQMEKDLKYVGIPKDRIAYLPNGVDTNLFRSWGEKEDNLLLFVGRITFDKGLHVLLRCLSHLKKSVRLAIVGPAWDLKYCQDMLKLIEKENRRGKHEIAYLGALDQAEILKWYQKSSIFILPSFLEAFPVVILEALSCETPIIATPVGGVLEIVRDHENGILVPLNNPRKLAEAIQYLLDNKDIRTKLGCEGRKWVIRNSSLEVIVKKLCDIYKKAIILNSRLGENS